MTHFLNPRALLFIATTAFFSACNLHKDVEGTAPEKAQLVLRSERHEPEPPPPGLISRFASIEEWLVHVTRGETPADPQLDYHIALFESPEGYVLSLSGLTTYDETPDRSVTRIEYQPRNGYYLLPETIKRKPALVKEEATQALKNFISSDTFKASFFARARSISTDWNGEIWRR